MGSKVYHSMGSKVIAGLHIRDLDHCIVCPQCSLYWEESQET